MAKKPLRLGEPGSPDGPPLAPAWKPVEETLGFKTGYYLTLAVLWGLVGLIGVLAGVLVIHLAF